MMAALLMMSSSSVAALVHMGSPENTWLHHWASIRLRIIIRRTSSKAHPQLGILTGRKVEVSSRELNY